MSGSWRSVGHVLFVVILLACGVRTSSAADAADRVRLLREKLHSPVAQTRVEAAWDLNVLGPKATDAAGELIQLLKDDEPRVREQADFTLAAIGSAVIPALVVATSDEDERLREKAAQLIGAFGPAAKQAIPALIRLANSGRNNDGCAAAKDALRHIGPDAIPALMELFKADDRSERYLTLEVLSSMGPAAKDTLPALLPMLEGDDVYERIHVLSKLVHIDPTIADREGAPILEAGLDDKDHFARAAAVGVWGEVGVSAKGTIPALLKAMKHPDSRVRDAAMGSIQQIGPGAKETVPLLLEELDHGAHRFAAVRALASIGSTSDKVIPALIVALHRKREDDGAATDALNCLMKMGPPAVPLLVTALGDADAYVRSRALFILETIGTGEKEVVPAATRLLGDPEVRVRVAAAKTLQRFHNSAAEAIPALIGTLADQDVFVRSAAAETLGTIRPPAHVAVDALRAAVKDRSPAVRRAAALALFRIDPTRFDAVPVLAEVLESGDFITRLDTPSALGEIGTPAAMSLLMSKCREEVWQVRLAAVKSLVRTGVTANEVARVLLGALTDEDTFIREAAAAALGERGFASADVQPALRRALMDSEGSVRQGARESLKQIEARGEINRP